MNQHMTLTPSYVSVGLVGAVPLIMGVLHVGMMLLDVGPASLEQLAITAVAMVGAGLVGQIVAFGSGPAGRFVVGLIVQGGHIWILKTLLELSWGNAAGVWAMILLIGALALAVASPAFREIA